MPIQEKDVKWVVEPQLGLYEQLYLPAILSGLATTERHGLNALFMGRAVTRQFPEQRPDLPANYRGVHRLNRDEQGRVKCVACYMCATICPAQCIFIEAGEYETSDPAGESRVIEKFPTQFVIDELRCIVCGLCVEACPCDAIRMDTGVHAPPTERRVDAILGKNDLMKRGTLSAAVQGGTGAAEWRDAPLQPKAAKLPGDQ